MDLKETTWYIIRAVRDIDCADDTIGMTKEEMMYQIVSTSITQLLEELREKPRYVGDNKANIVETYGYNQRNQEINDKIDKILNK